MSNKQAPTTRELTNNRSKEDNARWTILFAREREEGHWNNPLSRTILLFPTTMANTRRSRDQPEPGGERENNRNSTRHHADHHADEDAADADTTYWNEVDDVMELEDVQEDEEKQQQEQQHEDADEEMATYHPYHYEEETTSRMIPASFAAAAASMMGKESEAEEENREGGTRLRNNDRDAEEITTNSDDNGNDNTGNTTTTTTDPLVERINAFVFNNRNNSANNRSSSTMAVDISNITNITNNSANVVAAAMNVVQTKTAAAAAPPTETATALGLAIKSPLQIATFLSGVTTTTTTTTTAGGGEGGTKEAAAAASIPQQVVEAQEYFWNTEDTITELEHVFQAGQEQLQHHVEQHQQHQQRRRSLLYHNKNDSEKEDQNTTTAAPSRSTTGTRHEDRENAPGQSQQHQNDLQQLYFGNDDIQATVNHQLPVVGKTTTAATAWEDAGRPPWEENVVQAHQALVGTNAVVGVVEPAFTAFTTAAGERRPTMNREDPALQGINIDDHGRIDDPIIPPASKKRQYKSIARMNNNTNTNGETKGRPENHEEEIITASVRTRRNGNADAGETPGHKETVEGTKQQLPKMGKIPWEDSIVCRLYEPDKYACKAMWDYVRLVAPASTIPPGQYRWRSKDAIAAYCLRCKQQFTYTPGTSNTIKRHLISYHQYQVPPPTPTLPSFATMKRKIKPPGSNKLSSKMTKSKTTKTNTTSKKRKASSATTSKTNTTKIKKGRKTKKTTIKTSTETTKTDDDRSFAKTTTGVVTATTKAAVSGKTTATTALASTRGSTTAASTSATTTITHKKIIRTRNKNKGKPNKEPNKATTTNNNGGCSSSEEDDNDHGIDRITRTSKATNPASEQKNGAAKNGGGEDEIVISQRQQQRRELSVDTTENGNSNDQDGDDCARTSRSSDKYEAMIGAVATTTNGNDGSNGRSGTNISIIRNTNLRNNSNHGTLNMDVVSRAMMRWLIGSCQSFDYTANTHRRGIMFGDSNNNNIGYNNNLFAEFCRTLNPSFQLPSVDALTLLEKQKYDAIRNEIRLHANTKFSASSSFRSDHNTKNNNSDPRTTGNKGDNTINGESSIIHHSEDTGCVVDDDVDDNCYEYYSVSVRRVRVNTWHQSSSTRRETTEEDVHLMNEIFVYPVRITFCTPNTFELRSFTIDVIPEELLNEDREETTTLQSSSSSSSPYVNAVNLALNTYGFSRNKIVGDCVVLDWDRSRNEMDRSKNELPSTRLRTDHCIINKLDGIVMNVLQPIHNFIEANIDMTKRRSSGRTSRSPSFSLSCPSMIAYEDLLTVAAGDAKTPEATSIDNEENTDLNTIITRSCPGLVRIIAPFRDAIRTLFEEKYPTIGLSISIIRRIRDILHQQQEDYEHGDFEDECYAILFQQYIEHFDRDISSEREFLLMFRKLIYKDLMETFALILKNNGVRDTPINDISTSLATNISIMGWTMPLDPRLITMPGLSAKEKEKSKSKLMDEVSNMSIFIDQRDRRERDLDQQQRRRSIDKVSNGTSAVLDDKKRMSSNTTLGSVVEESPSTMSGIFWGENTNIYIEHDENGKDDVPSTSASAKAKAKSTTSANITRNAIEYAKQNVESYFNTVQSQRRIKDPLFWWKNNQEQFPELAILARKYLCSSSVFGHHPGTQTRHITNSSTGNDNVGGNNNEVITISCNDIDKICRMIFLRENIDML